MAARGIDGWHRHHAEHFGHERWETIHNSMHRDIEHLCYLNPFLEAGHRSMLEREYGLEATTVPGAYSFDVPQDNCLSRQFRAIDHSDEHFIFITPENESEEAASAANVALPRGPPAPFFFIDGAAAIAALALRAHDCDKVLDVCAAPGGKALVLASSMFGSRFGKDPFDPGVRGRLVCNEPSKERASRMQETMRNFLPASLLDPHTACGPHVVFTAADPGTPSNTMERNGPYDKILLDAPCTKDRNLLREQDAGKLHGWSQGTLKVSSSWQLKWLYNVLWLLREGGVLLFCTAALSHDECDGVVERLVRKAQGSFVLEVLPLEQGVCDMVPALAAENTPWGTRILPDRTPFGPLYFSRLRLVRRVHSAVAHLPAP